MWRCSCHVWFHPTRAAVTHSSRLANARQHREESRVDVNIFGLGINSDDASPFLGSDFHMPTHWTTGEGHRPRGAQAGMTFALFGDGLILATVTFLGCSQRRHRWEHRPSEDGLRHDYGPGWVLELDPNTWKQDEIPCEAVGQSYRYGHLSKNKEFTQLRLGA